MATPFKMKRTPAKGKLQDFFNTIGSQLRSNKRDIGADLKKKYSSKAQRANEVPKSGESKYQFDVRTRKPKATKETKTTKPKTTEIKKNTVSPKTTKPKTTEIGLTGGDASYTRYSATFDEHPNTEPMTREQWELYGDWPGKYTDSPVEKKSPSKKRGFKMNRKK